jgi:hypothetical protein
MENITAEQWVNNQFTKQIISEDIYASKQGIIESHILFAKYHVELALKQASEDVELETYGSFGNSVNKDSILNAYPIENINNGFLKSTE